MSRDGRKVIVIRKKTKGHHEEHGGAWKVAYADFVTAMMAFFLVMWLLGMSQDVKDLGWPLPEFVAAVADAPM